MKKTVPTITVYVIALVAHSTYTVMMAHFAFLAPGGLWAGGRVPWGGGNFGSLRVGLIDE